MQIKGEQSVNRVAWVTTTFSAGGIGTVCRYAAEGLARLGGGHATVVSLCDAADDRMDTVTRVRYVALGLEKHAPQAFLGWLRENPQQFVITNDVPRIEPAFPYFPRETLHIVGMHDSSRRQLDVAMRNHRWVDGVACVATHIQERLRARLNSVNFRGLLETVHNGAAFPPAPTRAPYSGPFRLLFMGSTGAFKGIFDLVPILQRVKKLGVPVQLMIVGGGSRDLLERHFKRKHLDSLVTWAGRVPHEECYRLAEESDVLLILSRKEAFGMVTIEAMAMGCVPLAYDITSGSREIIENGKHGLLLPLGNFAAWANAIKSLYENREEWRRLSAGAMQRARTQFNAETMASQLCAFLKRVEAHAKTCPSERKPGLPPEIEFKSRALYSQYQRLSPSIRKWLRNRIDACPRLDYWLRNRW
ncbi:MAG: glycosyltransferase family 4 protein [Verrucomicrobiota bacterium]|jgi:glycosyltransferase involved in cell wall biosynthesis